MPKQELILPSSMAVTVPRGEQVAVSVPGIGRAGYIASRLETWRDEFTARRVGALARLNYAEADLFNSQAAATLNFVKRQDALALLRDAPERHRHELEVRRVGRANEYREAQHIYETNEIRRRKEVVERQTDYVSAKTALTHARVALEDAEQQLRAQQEHGAFNYELAHHKKSLELLDIELSKAERREMFRQHTGELQSRGKGRVAGTLKAIGDDELYAKRAELNASGLDTTKIDAELDARRSRRGNAE